MDFCKLFATEPCFARHAVGEDVVNIGEQEKFEGFELERIQKKVIAPAPVRGDGENAEARAGRVGVRDQILVEVVGQERGKVFAVAVLGVTFQFSAVLGKACGVVVVFEKKERITARILEAEKTVGVNDHVLALGRDDGLCLFADGAGAFPKNQLGRVRFSTVFLQF